MLIGWRTEQRYFTVVTDPVAIYAAAVSSASVGWQVYAWRAERRNRVIVELVNAAVRVVGDDDSPGALLVVRNRGKQPIRATQAGVQITLGDRTEALHAVPTNGRQIVNGWHLSAELAGALESGSLTAPRADTAPVSL